MQRTQHARCPLLAVVLATAVLLAACTTPARAPEGRRPGPAPVASSLLVASITQFRPAEGTRTLRAGVTNLSRRTVAVSRAKVAWPGFGWRSVRIESPSVPAGQTAAFDLEYGAARCTASRLPRPRLVVVVDGVTRRLPLKVEDPQLLDRLHERACAEQRLRATTSLSLRLASRTARVRGAEYLPGQVVLRRRPGSTGQVTLTSVAGSVLLELVPRHGAAALPAVLRRGDRLLRVPVLVRSAHRCDGHALSNSQQTFVWSIYTRLGTQDIRTITIPDARARDLLHGLLDRDCS